MLVGLLDKGVRQALAVPRGSYAHQSAMLARRDRQRYGCGGGWRQLPAALSGSCFQMGVI
jgi:hypothetical protein